MRLDIFDLAEKIRQHSPRAANLVLSQGIPFIIPLARGLHARVIDVSDTHCELLMPSTRRSRNHVGSMYFGAQMTLADLTAGVLIFRRFPPGPFGALIKRVEAEFFTKAKGDIRCICRLSDEESATLESVRRSPLGKSEAWLPLELLDSSGTVVTRLRFLGALKRFDRKN